MTTLWGEYVMDIGNLGGYSNKKETTEERFSFASSKISILQKHQTNLLFCGV